jgi:acetyl-CoA carboxylase carboxyl transferase subunit alpha
VLKLTAQDLMDLKVVTGIISEPLGGAHRNPEATARSVKETVLKALGQTMSMDPDALLEQRYRFIRNLGRFIEQPPGR